MKQFIRGITSWAAIAVVTGAVLVMVGLGFRIIEVRSLAIPIGFLLTGLWFVMSLGLWRAYMYDTADYDSPEALVPGGLSKSLFMLAAFIVLLVASLSLTITDIEQGCLSSFSQETGLCEP